MTTTTSTSLAALSPGAGAAGCGCTGSTTASNPSNATTTMVGGKVCFENDNYRITMGDDNRVHITNNTNKNTGETYEAWGDPHMKINGKHTFDFWGTTTLQLDDGTKVTIETTPWVKDPTMTLSSKVTITNGDYGVQVSGIDTSQVGDLKFEQAQHWGGLLDAVVSDGNVLHENPAGAGFLGIDGSGRLRAVDQQYINETDLKKGGALEAQDASAMQQMAGLLTVTLVGGFLASMAGMARQGGDDNGSNAFVMVMSSAKPVPSWFAAAAAVFNA